MAIAIYRKSDRVFSRYDLDPVPVQFGENDLQGRELSGTEHAMRDGKVVTQWLSDRHNCAVFNQKRK